MNVYIYDGEFNAPMNGYVVDSHEPEIPDGKMVIFDRADPSEEPLPFTDPPEPWEFEADEGEY